MTLATHQLLDPGVGLSTGLLALLLAMSPAQDPPLPPEVQAFVADRDACDHFRGEPMEGNSPGQVERRTFVRESLEIHCAGTDRRLAALKKRHAGNAAVMSILARYEETIEWPGNGP